VCFRVGHSLNSCPCVQRPEATREMGGVMRRAEIVRGLEPLSAIDVQHARSVHNQFEQLCSVPALWERTFDELLGCFKTPESSIRAFRVLDSDGNGLIDARELLGALAVLSRGHLTERMQLLFDVFDLNKENELTFDECFLMLKRTMGGLRKMVSIHIPPEKVVHNMTKQVWKLAQKHRDMRITHSDWYVWWSSDASCRNGLKMFVWKPEEQRGLPTPDHYSNVDYTKGAGEDTDDTKKRGSDLLAVANARSPMGSRPGSAGSNRGDGTQQRSFDAGPRRASFSAKADIDGNVSRPVFFDDAESPTGFASPGSGTTTAGARKGSTGSKVMPRGANLGTLMVPGV